MFREDDVDTEVGCGACRCGGWLLCAKEVRVARAAPIPEGFVGIVLTSGIMDKLSDMAVEVLVVFGSPC
jgi:hypothetical protein